MLFCGFFYDFLFASDSESLLVAGHIDLKEWID